MGASARLALVQRQRRFEWAIARDAQARVAAGLVAGRTHDLLNLIQVVELAVFRLRHEGLAEDTLDELTRTARSATAQLHRLMELARPALEPARGAPVAATIRGLEPTLREVANLELHVDVPPDTATRCSAEQLEHLLIGLVLDAAEQRMALEVRERGIAGQPHVELVRGTARATEDGHERRVLEAIALRAGGELATSPRRGGGHELIIRLPQVT